MIFSIFAALFWPVDPNVPNDPNIGAGAFFIGGLGVVLAGLAHLYESKHGPSQAPMDRGVRRG